MKKFLVILLLTASMAAHAVTTMVAREGANAIRITDAPCTNAAVLKHIPKGLEDQYHAANVSFGKKDYQACWQLVPQGVHLFYEDGDQGLIPPAMFKPQETI